MPVFTLCSTIEGWWWFCSSSLKCAQQLSFIPKTHCAFFRWNNIFLGHCFFSSNTGYCIFRHLSTTKNFITKVRFSLILFCVSSIWTLAIESYSDNRWTKQPAMRAAGSGHSSRYSTLHVESAYCRRQNGLVNFIMKRHSTKSALEDFAAARKVLLSHKKWGTIWQWPKGYGWFCCIWSVLLGRCRNPRD